MQRAYSTNRGFRRHRCCRWCRLIMPWEVVCPSVTLADCDHIHWDSPKVISRINSVIFPRLICRLIWASLHRESKKGDTILLSISLLNIDRFSQFFHGRTQLELCNKIINKDPTSPQVCCYTTLWNVPTRQCTGAQGTRDNQAAVTGAPCIHLTWSVASE